MIEIFFLSLIQGITEFLPVSSSSHLVLASEYLDFKNRGLSIDVSLHIGSFIAVILYFHKDIINFYENKILFFQIFLSALPVMLVGFFLVETNFINKIRNIETIAWTTTLFGILLYISDKFKLQKNIKDNFNLKSALFIGILQIFSLIPGVSIIFLNRYNDYTNAFKIYKRTALMEIMPLISESFNIFLEIPLKIISRNYNYKVVSINWMGRKKGESKFKIKELGSKYLFTLIYCFIEKNLLNIKK